MSEDTSVTEHFSAENSSMYQRISATTYIQYANPLKHYFVFLPKRGSYPYPQGIPDLDILDCLLLGWTIDMYNRGQFEGEVSVMQRFWERVRMAQSRGADIAKTEAYAAVMDSDDPNMNLPATLLQEFAELADSRDAPEQLAYLELLHKSGVPTRIA